MVDSEAGQRAGERPRASLPTARSPRLAAVDRSVSLPLSFGQQRLWFLEQLAPGNAFYNMSASWQLRGSLDIDVLRAALNALVVRHEVLRTRIMLLDGVPRQQVGPAQPVDLEVHDVRGPDAAKRSRAIVVEALSRPFDLLSGQPMRFRLMRLADEYHVLTVAIHHAVCDVWSLRIIRRDLLALYDAMVAGQEPNLPVLPVQYGDFASWQRDWLSPGEVESRLGWWRGYLAGAPLVAEFPTDHSRPATPTYRAVSRRFAVGAETCKGLRRLVRQSSSTLFMVLLSAFGGMMARWTGQEDLLVGVPMAGRPRPELENLIGFFVNTVPVRVLLQGDPTFADLLSRVRLAVIDGLVHQDVPFEALVEDFAPERDLSRNPLVQLAFQLVNSSDPDESDDDTTQSLAARRWKARRPPSAHFDLSIRLVDRGRELDGEVVLAADLFEAATAARLADWLVQVLDKVAVDPSCRLSELPLATEQEWLRLSTGAPSLAPAGTLAAAFEAQAGRTPDEPALRWPGGVLTYRELSTRARELASRLRRAGVGPEVVVGLCTESPGAFAVGLWGIVLAGGAYVVLDPDYPAERLSALVAAASVPVVVTERTARGRAGVTRAALVVLDDADAGEAVDSGAAAAASPSSLAYVAFTSGSTGRPKGVMVTHDHLLNYVSWCLAELPLGPVRQVPLAAPVTFAGSVLSLFGAWLSGRCLVTGTREDPFSWCASVHEASFVKITPSALRLVADRFGPCWQRWGCVILASEPIRDSDWELISDIPGLAVVAHYGLTETNGAAAWWSTEGGRPDSGLLGRPAAGARLLVLDRWGVPVGINTPGELCVGGRSVARGYLAQPGQTAERFVPDPYGPPGSRLYRTGDLVRWRADGNLQFIGRIDEQIKIRGFRIEPGEVETVMEQHPAVQAAVVSARPDQTGSLQLVAWITATAGYTADPHVVRNWAGERLPDHMVPTIVTVLDEFPLNANGKLNHSALPEPQNVRGESEGPVTRPETPTEQVLAAIWSDLLDRDDISTNDNFFSVGGHSLLAIQLIAQVQEELGVDYPIITFFEFPTIAEMATTIDQTT